MFYFSRLRHYLRKNHIMGKINPQWPGKNINIITITIIIKTEQSSFNPPLQDPHRLSFGFRRPQDPHRLIYNYLNPRFPQDLQDKVLLLATKIVLMG